MSERGNEFQLFPGHFQSEGNEQGHGLGIHTADRYSTIELGTVIESRADIHRRLGQMDIIGNKIKQVESWMEQSDKNYQLYITQVARNAECKLRIEHLLAENSSLDIQLNVALHDLDELKAEKIAS